LIKVFVIWSLILVQSLFFGLSIAVLVRVYVSSVNVTSLAIDSILPPLEAKRS